MQRINIMINRLKRYWHFGLQYLFSKIPKSLDFTMKDIKLYEETNGIYHGYSKTDEKHLYEIFRSLTFTEENKLKLLDIGCGKGVLLKVAVQFPFVRIAGIELQDNLVQIAKRNFQILGIEPKIECMQSDAVLFEQYNDYNVFFLFNPFSEKILGYVVEKILGSRANVNSPIVFIYDHPRFLNVFQDETNILEEKWIYDSGKDYDTCILKVIGKEVNRDDT